MACFIIPAVTAIIVSITRKIAKSLNEKLWSLEAMLWGGVIILLVEHVWHGEIVLWPPFLTAMNSPEEWSIALQEIQVVGLLMTTAVVITWSLIILISRLSTSITRSIKFYPLSRLKNSR